MGSLIPSSLKANIRSISEPDLPLEKPFLSGLYEVIVFLKIILKSKDNLLIDFLASSNMFFLLKSIYGKYKSILSDSQLPILKESNSLLKKSILQSGYI